MKHEPYPNSPVFRRSIAAATVVGFFLRVSSFGRLGLNHFDEGIYALAGNWPFLPAGVFSLDPGLIPYAPPGFVLLVGLAYATLGNSDSAAIFVSIIIGAASIPIVALIAARSAGPRSGIIAAWCLTCSGPHIAFSRMCLTDVAFFLTWSLAFAGSVAFLKKPSYRSAIILGVLVGLSQQFKYNGWLMGGFVMVAALIEPFFAGSQPRAKLLFRLFGFGGLGALVSASINLPWFLFVESHDGYSSLLNHQRSYLGSVSTWLTYFFVQSDQAAAMIGPSWLSLITGIGFFFALAGGSLNSYQSLKKEFVIRLIFAFCLVPLLSNPAMTGLVACAFVINWQRSADRILGVGWLGYLIISPFYHPYARLWLPVDLFQCLMLGAIGVSIGSNPLPSGTWWFGWRQSALFASLLATGIGFLAHGPGFPFTSSGPIHRSGLLDPTDSLRDTAARILAAVPRDKPRLQIFGRPALVYYLAGRTDMQRLPELAQLTHQTGDSDWALVDSSLLTNVINPDADRGGERLLGRVSDHWQVVASFLARNSLPTALDLDPGAARRSRIDSVALIWLLRSKRSMTNR